MKFSKAQKMHAGARRDVGMPDAKPRDAGLRTDCGRDGSLPEKVAPEGGLPARRARRGKGALGKAAKVPQEDGTQERDAPKRDVLHASLLHGVVLHGAVPEEGPPDAAGRVDEAPPLPRPRQPERLGPVRTYFRKRQVKDRSLAVLRSLPGLPGRLARAAVTGSRAEFAAGLRDWGLEDPADLLRLARRMRRVAPGWRFAAQVEALTTARAGGWDAAAPLFRRLAEGADGGAGAASAAGLLAPPRDHPAELALPREDRPAHLDGKTAQRIVVYTCWRGSRPPLAPVFGAPEGLRFLCFSDHAAEIPGWEIVPADPAESDAAYRIRPHRVLATAAPDAEWSLYMAPDRLVMGNLHTLFARWLLPQSLALWRHPQGGDWHDLAERHLVGGTAPVEAVLAQARACAGEGLARERSAWGLGLLWRRHADPEVAAAMETWWALEREAPGAPELSLCRALARTPAAPPPVARPATLPALLGRADSNIFFDRFLQPAVRAPLASPPLRRGRLPVTFLYSAPRARSGNAIMRGEQLSRMIAARFPDRYEVTYSSEIGSVRHEVVIVNRTAIEDSPPEALGALKRRGNIVVSDWQDLPVVPAKNTAFDAHLAMSPLQQVDMSRMFPDRPVFLVTHHVNPDVPRVVPPGDRLRTVFIGLHLNTVVPGTLRDRVDFLHAVNADFTAHHWRATVPNYNCHWIVRQISQKEWRKPFLKGFVAARCRSPVIVTRDDQNAAHYLGDDYPFYAESVENAELERVWIRAAASFGGPEWRMALEIMRQVEARSTDEVVCADFAHMIEALIA
jgi:hypothetical protein